MAYTLGGSTIKAPQAIKESNNTQYAQQRTLAGTVNRDYFGLNKRVWVLSYDNIQKADFDTINTVYQTYLSTGTAQTWSSDETNYTIASTTVHININDRGFGVGGDGYLSSFDVILSEV